MKDIDFDELDRAVNSLIGGKTETVEPVISTPSATVDSVAFVAPVPDLVIPTPAVEPTPVIAAPIVAPVIPEVELPTPVMPQPAPVVSAQPVVSPVQAISTPIQTTQPVEKPQTITRLVAVPYPPKPRPLITTPVAPAKAIPINTFESLASKRGAGRFVDVVNPTSQNRLDPRRMSASTSETIKQMMNSTPDLHEHTMPVVEPVMITPAPIVATPPVVPIPSPTALTSPVVAPTAEVDDDEDIDQISNFIDSTINSANKKQDEKPFFSDSKVEKRPLGAFNGAMPQKPTPTPAPAPSPSIQFGISGNSSSASSQLPPELQNDLLSIESDTMPEMDDNKFIDIPAVEMGRFETQNPETPNVQPVAPQVTQSQPSNVIAITPVQASEVAVPATSPQMPTQTSINQQYQEKPNSKPTSTEPIYDATAYHELEKKSSKSGLMMWVLRIVGLIVIGAGVGVVAFFFVLPNL